MLDMIKEDLIRHTNLSTVNYKIDEIIDKVEESGVYDFIRSVSSFEHILILYKDKSIIDRLLGVIFLAKWLKLHVDLFLYYLQKLKISEI